MADINTIIEVNNSEITNKTEDNSITPEILGARLNSITGELRPYQTYTALLTQTSTTNPEVIELETGLGVSLTWSRESEGVFKVIPIEDVPVFTEGKTMVFITKGYDTFYSFQSYEIPDEQTILIHQVDGQGAGFDNMNGLSVEIRVYY